MRAATFAFRRGRGRELTLRAFREAFRDGNDLAVPAHVLRAAAAVGIDAQALSDATCDPEIKLALRAATEAAHERGVFGVPTVAVGAELFWGEDRLADAAVALRRAQR
jgi:2-hydroxychromene-2-carboxylate isomerase